MPHVIHNHTFSNGLVLLAEPIAGLESAAFTLLEPAGCVYEPENRLGLAGLVCELTMRGAGQRDSRGLVEALDRLGVERHESVSDVHIAWSGATLAKNLLPALAIYADVLRRPQLPAGEVEPLRRIAQQELRALEDDPAHKVMLELKRHFYPTPWGRSSQGTNPGLAAVTHADLQKQYRARFGPRGMILGVAGRIEWNKLRDEVEALFGDWQPQPEVALVEGQRGSVEEQIHHEANQTQIGVAYTTVPYRDERYFDAWGAVGALSGGMSSRLFTEVREKRGLCYSVYASYHTQRERAAVFCYAGTSAERAQETLDVLLGELVRLAQGVEPHELERLKARIKSSLIMQQESSAARSGAIARDWYHLGRVRTLDEIGQRVDSLGCDTINAYLAEHPPRDFTVVTLGPKPLEVRREVS